jgi:hypothetical protein
MNEYEVYWPSLQVFTVVTPACQGALRAYAISVSFRPQSIRPSSALVAIEGMVIPFFMRSLTPFNRPR